MDFVELLTADRAARDHLSRFGERLATLPVTAIAPVVARMVAALIRGMLALAVVLLAGYAFGFRMSCRPGYAAAFVLVAVLLCMAVGLGADALGSSTKRIQGASHFLFVPQLLLFMLPTGRPPEKTFPAWLRPLVRNQPVSQIAETLRGLTIGHVAASNLAAGLAWCAGMVLDFGAITLRMQSGTMSPRSGLQGPAREPDLAAGRSAPHPLAPCPCGDVGISLRLPIFLLFVYEAVLGEQVRKVTGVDGVYGLVVPLSTVLSGLLGSLGGSVNITMDRELGLLSRMWVLPVSLSQIGFARSFGRNRSRRLLRRCERWPMAERSYGLWSRLSSG